MTFDPRNSEMDLPVLVPFVPFQRQIDWLEWLLARLAKGENGLTEKSRDAGCSVTAMSLFCTLALFNRDFVAGVGSRKEMLVDSVGDPNTLLHKARTFLNYIPIEFRGGWDESLKSASSHMKILIPDTGSVIIGEAGDNIGRGGRARVYLVDESAHIKNQQAVDLALSYTTRCRIDLSSVNGTDNNFAEKRFSGRVPVFTFHWRDDPRKSQEWYDRERERLPPVIVAQELDIDYSASKSNILIPSAWVQAAIYAHLKIPASDSKRIAGLDVADEGDDKNACSIRAGIVLIASDEWSGKGSDIFATAERAALMCDLHATKQLRYDADGLGVGLRGDFRIINSRDSRKNAKIEVAEHQGSAAVVDPEAFVIEPDVKNGHAGRKNVDFFANYKAQSWWALRVRFENTYKLLTKGIACDPAKCISISKDLKDLSKITQELSQPTYSINSSGKIVVDKKPDGTKSPNFADSIVIAYAPTTRKAISMFSI